MKLIFLVFLHVLFLFSSSYVLKPNQNSISFLSIDGRDQSTKDFDRKIMIDLEKLGDDEILLISKRKALNKKKELFESYNLSLTNPKSGLLGNVYDDKMKIKEYSSDQRFIMQEVKINDINATLNNSSKSEETAIFMLKKEKNESHNTQNITTNDSQKVEFVNLTINVEMVNLPCENISEVEKFIATKAENNTLTDITSLFMNNSSNGSNTSEILILFLNPEKNDKKITNSSDFKENNDGSSKENINKNKEKLKQNKSDNIEKKIEANNSMNDKKSEESPIISDEIQKLNEMISDQSNLLETNSDKLKKPLEEKNLNNENKGKSTQNETNSTKMKEKDKKSAVEDSNLTKQTNASNLEISKPETIAKKNETTSLLSSEKSAKSIPKILETKTDKQNSTIPTLNEKNLSDNQNSLSEKHSLEKTKPTPKITEMIKIAEKEPSIPIVNLSENNKKESTSTLFSENISTNEEKKVEKEPNTTLRYKKTQEKEESLEGVSFENLNDEFKNDFSNEDILKLEDPSQPKEEIPKLEDPLQTKEGISNDKKSEHLPEPKQILSHLNEINKLEKREDLPKPKELLTNLNEINKPKKTEDLPQAKPVISNLFETNKPEKSEFNNENPQNINEIPKNNAIIENSIKKELSSEKELTEPSLKLNSLTIKDQNSSFPPVEESDNHKLVVSATINDSLAIKPPEDLKQASETTKQENKIKPLDNLKIENPSFLPKKIDSLININEKKDESMKKISNVQEQLKAPLPSKFKPESPKPFENLLNDKQASNLVLNKQNDSNNAEKIINVKKQDPLQKMPTLPENHLESIKGINHNVEEKIEPSPNQNFSNNLQTQDLLKNDSNLDQDNLLNKNNNDQIVTSLKNESNHQNSSSTPLTPLTERLISLKNTSEEGNYQYSESPKMVDRLPSEVRGSTEKIKMDSLPSPTPLPLENTRSDGFVEIRRMSIPTSLAKNQEVSVFEDPVIIKAPRERQYFGGYIASPGKSGGTTFSSSNNYDNNYNNEQIINNNAPNHFQKLMNNQISYPEIQNVENNNDVPTNYPNQNVGTNDVQTNYQNPNAGSNSLDQVDSYQTNDNQNSEIPNENNNISENTEQSQLQVQQQDQQEMPQQQISEESNIGGEDMRFKKVKKSISSFKEENDDEKVLQDMYKSYINSQYNGDDVNIEEDLA